MAAGAAAQSIVVVEDTGDINPYDTYVRGSMVKRALNRAGLSFRVIQDKALLAHNLTAVKLVVLPSNPGLPRAVADHLTRFSHRGGNLIVFPPLPPDLADVVGVDDPGTMALADDSTREAVSFDLTIAPALPAVWRQRDWAVQHFTPKPTARLVGAWQQVPRRRELLPAAVMVGGGAYIGAVINGDDRTGEAHLLLGLATHYAPELWHQAVPSLIASVGRVGDSRSLSEIKERLRTATLPDERRALAWTALTTATEKRERAQQMYEAARRIGTTVPKPGEKPPSTSPVERYSPVAALGWEAQQAAEQAYYISQPGRGGEFRGVWLQNAGGLKEWDWQRTILSLRENNFNAIFINVLNPGYANYPSDVLPHVTVEGADPLAEALHWCRQFGVECHVWMMVNYIRPLAPAEWFAGFEQAGRLQQNRSGQTLRWLRPADRRNRDLTVRMATEVARRYDIDGLHLDYIRYNGPEADFSDAEKTAFEAQLLDAPINWLTDVERGGRYRTEWLRWRTQQVDAQVAAIAQAVRAARPRIKVSAAVYPIFVDALYAVGQDPVKWAHEGWVDFLCPMNYQTFDTTFFRYLNVQQRDVGERVPLYPGIAAWRHESPADTISQVRGLRELRMPGFVLFHLDRRLVSEWLPAMRLGTTALPPELGPEPPLTAVAAFDSGQAPVP